MLKSKVVLLIFVSEKIVLAGAKVKNYILFLLVILGFEPSADTFAIFNTLSVLGRARTAFLSEISAKIQTASEHKA